MFVITNAQMEALAQIPVKDFEEKTLVYLRENFPGNYEIIGEKDLRLSIQYGIKKADTYDFIRSSEITLFICLMLMLGSDFDIDPQLPWTGEILNDEETEEASMRMDRLFDEANDHLDKILGENNQYLENAMLKIQNIPLKDLLPVSSMKFDDHLASRLKTIYPEKYKKIGKTGISAMIAGGLESARDYGISSELGLSVYIVLMFMLGSGFDKDPQLPWAARILKDRTAQDEGKTVDRLYNNAIAYIEKWLAFL